MAGLAEHTIKLQVVELHKRGGSWSAVPSGEEECKVQLGEPLPPLGALLLEAFKGDSQLLPMAAGCFSEPSQLQFPQPHALAAPPGELAIASATAAAQVAAVSAAEGGSLASGAHIQPTQVTGDVDDQDEEDPTQCSNFEAAARTSAVIPDSPTEPAVQRLPLSPAQQLPLQLSSPAVQPAAIPASMISPGLDQQAHQRGPSSGVPLEASRGDIHTHGAQSHVHDRGLEIDAVSLALLPSVAAGPTASGGQPAVAEQAVLTEAIQHPACKVQLAVSQPINQEAPPVVTLPPQQGGGLADFDVMIEAPAAGAGSHSKAHLSFDYELTQEASPEPPGHAWTPWAGPARLFPIQPAPHFPAPAEAWAPPLPAAMPPAASLHVGPPHQTGSDMRHHQHPQTLGQAEQLRPPEGSLPPQQGTGIGAAHGPASIHVARPLGHPQQPWTDVHAPTSMLTGQQSAAQVRPVLQEQHGCLPAPVVAGSSLAAGVSGAAALPQLAQQPGSVEAENASNPANNACSGGGETHGFALQQLPGAAAEPFSVRSLFQGAKASRQHASKPSSGNPQPPTWPWQQSDSALHAGDMPAMLQQQQQLLQQREPQHQQEETNTTDAARAALQQPQQPPQPDAPHQVAEQPAGSTQEEPERHPMLPLPAMIANLQPGLFFTAGGASLGGSVAARQRATALFADLDLETDEDMPARPLRHQQRRQQVPVRPLGRAGQPAFRPPAAAAQPGRGTPFAQPRMLNKALAAQDTEAADKATNAANLQQQERLILQPKQQQQQQEPMSPRQQEDQGQEQLLRRHSEQEQPQQQQPEGGPGNAASDPSWGSGDQLTARTAEALLAVEAPRAAAGGVVPAVAEDTAAEAVAAPLEGERRPQQQGAQEGKPADYEVSEQPNGKPPAGAADMPDNRGPQETAQEVFMTSAVEGKACPAGAARAVAAMAMAAAHAGTQCSFSLGSADLLAIEALEADYSARKRQQEELQQQQLQQVEAPQQEQEHPVQPCSLGKRARSSLPSCESGRDAKQACPAVQGLSPSEPAAPSHDTPPDRVQSGKQAPSTGGSPASPAPVCNHSSAKAPDVGLGACSLHHAQQGQDKQRADVLPAAGADAAKELLFTNANGKALVMPSSAKLKAMMGLFGEVPSSPEQPPSPDQDQPLSSQEQGAHLGLAKQCQPAEPRAAPGLAVVVNEEVATEGPCEQQQQLCAAEPHAAGAGAAGLPLVFKTAGGGALKEFSTSKLARLKAQLFGEEPSPDLHAGVESDGSGDEAEPAPQQPGSRAGEPSLEHAADITPAAAYGAAVRRLAGGKREVAISACRLVGDGQSLASAGPGVDTSPAPRQLQQSGQTKAAADFMACPFQTGQGGSLHVDAAKVKALTTTLFGETPAGEADEADGQGAAGADENSAAMANGAPAAAADPGSTPLLRRQLLRSRMTDSPGEPSGDASGAAIGQPSGRLAGPGPSRLGPAGGGLASRPLRKKGRRQFVTPQAAPKRFKPPSRLEATPAPSAAAAPRLAQAASHKPSVQLHDLEGSALKRRFVRLATGLGSGPSVEAVQSPIAWESLAAAQSTAGVQVIAGVQDNSPLVGQPVQEGPAADTAAAAELAFGVAPAHGLCNAPGGGCPASVADKLATTGTAGKPQGDCMVDALPAATSAHPVAPAEQQQRQQAGEVSAPQPPLPLDSRQAADYMFQSSEGQPLGWEALRSHLLEAGANPSYASQAWVKNHFRWVVWKLARLELLHQEEAGGHLGLLTAEFVMDELKARYEREFNRGQAAPLKRILQHDAAPGGLMVLLVASVRMLPPRKGQQLPSVQLELTDGWYWVLAACDDPLALLAKAGKISPGDKLRICGAELQSPGPGEPLEAAKSAFLKLSCNGVHKVHSGAKLGWQKHRSCIVPLGSVHPEGGLIPRTLLVVHRKYPQLMWVKLPSGIDMYQTQRHFQAAQRRADDDISKMEAFVDSEIQEAEKTLCQRWLARGRKERGPLTSAERQYAQMVTQPGNEDEVFQRLSPTEVDALRRYQEVRHAELNQKRQALLKERLQGLSAVPETAQPTMFLLVGEVTHRQLADGGSPSGISGGSGPRQRRPAQALIMIRRPPEDLEEIQEGQVYSVTGLQPDKSAMRAGSSPALQLRTSKRAQWQLQSSPSLGQWLSWLELPRQHVALQGLACRAPGSTFDFTGVVCKAGQLYRDPGLPPGQFSQWIFLADASITTPAAMAEQTSSGQQAQPPQQPAVQRHSGGPLLPGPACPSGGSCGRKRKLPGAQQRDGAQEVPVMQGEQPMEQQQKQKHGEELGPAVKQDGQQQEQGREKKAVVQAEVRGAAEQVALPADTLPCSSPSGQACAGGVPAHCVGPVSGEAGQAEVEVALLKAKQVVASQTDGQAAANTSRASEPEACACPEAAKEETAAATAAEVPLHGASVRAATAGVPVAGGPAENSHGIPQPGAYSCAQDAADLTGVPTQPMISDGEGVAAAPDAVPNEGGAVQGVEKAAGKEVGAAEEPLRDAPASAAASVSANCLAAQTETAAQAGQAPFGLEQAPVRVAGAALTACHPEATTACLAAKPAFDANQPWLLAVRLVGTHEAVSWVDPGDEGSVFTFRDLQLWGQHDVPNRLWKAEGSQRTAVIRARSGTTSFKGRQQHAAAVEAVDANLAWAASNQGIIEQFRQRAAQLMHG